MNINIVGGEAGSKKMKMSVLSSLEHKELMPSPGEKVLSNLGGGGPGGGGVPGSPQRTPGQPGD